MSELNVDKYLNYVREEEARGIRFGEMEEFLEELADYTQINRFRGDPYVGRLFENRWVSRILAALLVLLLLFAPVIHFAETVAAGQKPTAVGLLIWFVLLLMLVICFVCNRKRRNH